MKGKRWRVLRLTVLTLMFVSFCCAFVVAKVDSYLFWFLFLTVGVISLCAVGQLLVIEGNEYRFFSGMDSEINRTERDSLYQFPAPALILDKDGLIIWYNQAFTEVVYSESDAYGIPLYKILKIEPEKLQGKKETIITFREREFRLTFSEADKSGTTLTLLYFEDVTDYVHLQQEYEETRPSVVLIVIDNFEDMFQDVKESEKAHILVQLEKVLENFMEKSTGIFRKISNDRFIAIVEEKQLQVMLEERFKILDKARAISVGERLSVTLSIGVGHGAENLADSEEYAKQALDMALGRGGDQAAVKTENGFEFFGGVSKGIEKHAKVKTRIIATALTELIDSSENVFIMGHQYGDLDSIGSAAGLCGAIHNLGKQVQVVVDPEKNLAEPLILRLKESDEEFDIFISPEEALEQITEQTLLIIVDTHNKEYLESRELYENANHVVVIDHHRKTVNYIENAVIFHHEPYASSASEMVAELIQYFGEIGKLSAYYAEALMAGIMLDTKNFVMRTGVRTFEAAAFLRKLGADTVAVRGLFANSIESYQRKIRLVASAEVYKRCAIAVGDGVGDEARVVAAQAADELMGIAGVDASFVLYEKDGSINFSARSMGAMNVQLIMEKLGGGGHQTMAGAQLQNVTIEEAKAQLRGAIDEHLEEIS